MPTVLAVLLTAWLTRFGPAHIPDSEFYRAAALTAQRGHLGFTNLTSYFSGFTPLQILRHGGITKFVEFPLGYPALLSVLSRPAGFDWGWRLTQWFAAAAIGWSSTVISAGARTGRARISSACVIVVVTLLTPAITATILRVQTEFALCGLVALVIAGTVRHVRDGRPITIAVVAASLAPLMRFVGVGIIALPILAMRSRRPATRVGLAAVMLAPAAANQFWIRSAGVSRIRDPQFLAWDHVKRVALTTQGWFWRRDAADPGFPKYSAWTWVALVATLVLVALGAWFVRRPALRSGAAWVPLVGAASLLAALLLGMIFADHYVQPDTRQMLPIQLCLLWTAAMIIVLGWDRWRPWLRISVGAMLIVWLVVAIAPWSSFAQRIHEVPFTDATAIAEAAQATGAKIIFADNAGALDATIDTPAAYLPFDPNIITGERVDVVAQTQQLVCNMGAHDAAAMLLPHHPDFHNWAKVIEVLDNGVGQGLLERRTTKTTITYVPTGKSCPAGRYPGPTP